MLQAITPERHEEIQVKSDQARAEWEDFQNSLEKTKSHLQQVLHLWKKYEEEFEAFSAWLRDMEARVKSETSQQVEIDSLEQQLKTLEGLQQDVKNHQKPLENLMDLTQEISKESPESRVTNQVTQLKTRFTALEKALQNAVVRVRDLMKTEESYKRAKRDLQSWLDIMERKLELSAEASGDRALLEGRLETLK
ncbi:nesprin-3-like, partial [Limulus polyphemus]|uniref:Nesprin-3-like n=1 Tax=Limulus polyphemus TaxID=6850 RepID=A0ABM1TGR5_LIMPO